MSTKRQYLTLQEKVDIAEFHQSKAKFGSRKIAEHYECGKTNIQSILSHKDEILSAWKQNANVNDYLRQDVNASTLVPDMSIQLLLGAGRILQVKLFEFAYQ